MCLLWLLAYIHCNVKDLMYVPYQLLILFGKEYKPTAFMVGRLFQNYRFKNAVFAPTNHDYIDGQQNRFDLYHVLLDHPRWSARAST